MSNALRGVGGPRGGVEGLGTHGDCFPVSKIICIHVPPVTTGCTHGFQTTNLLTA